MESVVPKATAGVQRGLDPCHHLPAIAVLVGHMGQLADADPVFTRHCAAHAMGRTNGHASTIVGEFDDTWREGVEQTRVALETVGITPEIDIAGTQGHVLDLDPAGLMDWIDNALGRND